MMKKLPSRVATPKIALPNETGAVVDLNQSKAKAVVLFFYPKDSTPGCTVEAKGFSKTISKFRKMDVEVYGISGGSVESKAKFCSKSKLSVPMLADEDFSVAKKFKVYGKKKFMGREYMGIFRTTFVIAKGKVVKVFPEVSPESHPEEVLDFLKVYFGAGKKLAKRPEKKQRRPQAQKKTSRA